MSLLFLLAGIAVGLTQAGLLGRAVVRGTAALLLIPRLLSVAAVLVFAAMAGHLATAVIGWMAGFGLGGALVHRRLR